MTKQRNDEHSTEFGLWLRQQPEVDSRCGYVATNIDYMWRNYNTGRWMIIEEKRYNSKPEWWQQQMFNLIDNACSLNKLYMGFHLLVFENTSPDDGKIYLDNKEISRKELISFLKFEL